MSDALSRLPELLGAHLRLVLLSLAVGAAASLPLGIVAARRPRWGRFVLGSVGTIQTIPGLALLALMVPALAAIGPALSAGFGIEIRSIGFLPAFLALTLYSMLPIVRNTVVGLRSVDPAVVEAALGVGMTDREKLWRVELPLAAPAIVGGLRTATVWIVGMATLSTPVGAPSLGDFIFSGLQTRNAVSVVVGCVAAAGLALVLDAAIGFAERRAGRFRGRPAAAVAVLTLALGAALAVGLGPGGRAGAEREVVVGAKTFTEQYVLAAVLSETLAGEAGLESRTVASLGSTVAFDALRSGEIDLYVDYSGTIWATILREPGSAPRDVVLERLRRELPPRFGVEVLASLGFENAYALAMDGERASRLGVGTIGDLRPLARRMEIGGDYELFHRPEWRAIVERYDLDFRAVRSMDSSLMYRAVANGEVDVIGAFSTDGRIDAYDLAVLDDPLGAIPPYDAVVLGRSGLGAAAAAAIRSLDGAIDAGTMREMNFAVDEEGRSPESVARAWVRERLEAASSRRHRWK